MTSDCSERSSSGALSFIDYDRFHAMLPEKRRNLLISEIGKLPVGDVDWRRLSYVLDRYACKVGGTSRGSESLLHRVHEAHCLRYFDQITLILCTQLVHQMVCKEVVLHSVHHDFLTNLGR